MQTRTSKMTSQNFKKENKAYQYIPPHTKMIFDYGCGRFKNNKDYCENKGIEWYGYDPYWKEDIENQKVLSFIEKNKDKLDCIVCSNVLNVIDNNEEVEKIISYLANISNSNTIVVFSCYRGDGTSIGKETKKDCWQRNEKPQIWKKRLSKYFNVMYNITDIFICKKR